MSVQILQGDCRETLKTLADDSVEMVLLDPPHDEWPEAARVFEQVPRLCQSGFVVCFCRLSDILLDPFGGSGTTAQVALEEGRAAILCELNPAYVGLINQRLAGVTPSLFGRVAA